MPGEIGGSGAPQGLSWSWELDFASLIESLGEAGLSGAGPECPDPSDPDQSDAVSAGPCPSADPRLSAAGPAGASPRVAWVPGSTASAAGDPGGAPAVGGPDGVPVAGAPDDMPVTGAPNGAPVPGAPDGSPAVGLDAAVDDVDDVTRHGGEGLPAWVLTGRVAERLAPGPDLAAWLAMAPVARLAGGDLAVVAGSWRRMASWAQAQELAAVAQIASRSAARDADVGTGADGRPARICRGGGRGGAGADDVAVRRSRVGGPGGCAGLAARGDEDGTGWRGD